VTHDLASLIRTGVRRVEHRATGQFLKVEGPSGIVVSIPGWMLDVHVCAGMKTGSPQVDLAARAKAAITLAQIMMQAAGLPVEELDDDRR